MGSIPILKRKIYSGEKISWTIFLIQQTNLKIVYMRNFILLLLTGFLFPCYGQEKVEFETHVPNRSSIELVHNLDSAYSQLDSLEIIDFFNQWNQDIKPIMVYQLYGV